ASRLASRAAAELAAATRRLGEGSATRLQVQESSAGFGELGAALTVLQRQTAAALSDLERERDRLRGVLAGMREGVLLLDPEGRVALVNPALREMLLLGTNVEGKQPLEIIRHAELVALFERAESGEEPASGELGVGGIKPRRLMVQAVRIPGASGGLLAVFVDVTNLRKLETLRRDFVANASHELRTPVAAILSAAETIELAIGRDPEGARDFVGVVTRNAERLKNLVDDLLDLSRIESHEFRVHAEAVDVAELCDAVVELFRERATKKGITISAAALEGTTARADRRGLEHVLTNLVDNGVKYCASGSSITLAAEDAAGERVRISVVDDGPGIGAEHLPRLFERFYRVDPGRSRQVGGTGLGLSIVKHLVEAMGGTVDVESEPGRGTRFSILLPATEPPDHPERATNPPPRVKAGPGGAVTKL
ncbi:MAG: PAS domain-containing sensor histidine kinase, partial [Deltaproteobacteria bacterium]|nr:PAS domain-containing sensor histidine kinase [Deltaproteobacteria bacterium]